MKKYLVTTYTREGDMFVPRIEAVSLVGGTAPRGVLTAVALLVLIATPVFVTESATRAYFSDTERSNANTLAAGPLDIEVSADPLAASITSGEAGAEFSFTVTPHANSLPFVYEVSTFASGNAAFCTALNISGVPVGPQSTFDPVLLDISFSDGGVADGAQCEVEVTFNAYQMGGVAGTEYHDVEKISLMLTATVGEQFVESFSLQSFSVQEDTELPPLEDTPPVEKPLEESPLTEEPTTEELVVDEPEPVLPPADLLPTDPPPSGEAPVDPPAEDPPPTDPPADLPPTEDPDPQPESVEPVVIDTPEGETP